MRPTNQLLALLLLAPGLYANERAAVGSHAPCPLSVARRSLIPQIADGAGWKTSLIVTSLEQRPVGYQLTFYSSDGRLMPVSFVNHEAASQLCGVLPPNGSATIETLGTAETLAQGWVEVYIDGEALAQAIFRQRVSGRPDFEAASPASPSGRQRFVIAFDNTAGLLTAVALLNGHANETARATFTFREENGGIAGIETVALGPFAHAAFALTDRFAYLSGRRGSAEIVTNTGQVSGLGLRFNPTGPFTTLTASFP